MIKVIASDMDGTLLGDDHRIAPETRKGFPISVLWKAAVRRYIRSSFLRQMWSSWRNSAMS